MHEIGADLPHLGSFSTGWGLQVARFFRRLRAEDRVPCALALVKRWMPGAADALGEPMTETEQGYVRRYRQQVTTPTMPERNRPIPRKALVPAIDREMRPLFGLGRDCGSHLHYSTLHAGWTISVIVGFGGPRKALSYDHRIEYVNDEGMPRFGLLKTSLLSYLGVAGETSWDRLDVGEEESASRCIAELSRRFLAAVPSMIDGMPPPDSRPGTPLDRWPAT